ncbi:fibril-forming collagen alpha chain-like [Camelus ferus]|uniref:Fibril-forming collagen alpha chain-like n=1 Tax=Camelus ferus TaxID=419612 RepID=A0A8B8TGK0_CAMFR|nr:fibril-forming collagen alpha chain-like [Camelus ferus]
MVHMNLLWQQLLQDLERSGGGCQRGSGGRRLQRARRWRHPGEASAEPASLEHRGPRSVLTRPGPRAPHRPQPGHPGLPGVRGAPAGVGTGGCLRGPAGELPGTSQLDLELAGDGRAGGRGGDRSPPSDRVPGSAPSDAGAPGDLQLAGSSLEAATAGEAPKFALGSRKFGTPPPPPASPLAFLQQRGRNLTGLGSPAPVTLRKGRPGRGRGSSALLTSPAHTRGRLWKAFPVVSPNTYRCTVLGV